MHRGLSEPHLFNAGPNPLRLIRNLEGLIGQEAVDRLHEEIDRNVALLFALGEAHYRFAVGLPRAEWRQKMSRFYYGAYNAKRALALKHSGQFSTDSSDHKNIDQVPNEFPDATTYRVRLANLRDDRNLADYSHLGSVNDLLLSPDDAENLVENFVNAVRDYLVAQGVQL